jgi:hypothetical protein
MYFCCFGNRIKGRNSEITKTLRILPGSSGRIAADGIEAVCDRQPVFTCIEVEVNSSQPYTTVPHLCDQRGFIIGIGNLRRAIEKCVGVPADNQINPGNF